MPFAKLQNVQIYYEWTGPEHLPLLVFSNSLGTNLHMWDPQVQEFSRHFRLLRYDTRGFGQSELAPGGHTMTQLSQDVIGLLDVLGQRKPVCFCGLSMGGMIGMTLGAQAPRRFRKLVLCNTAARFGTAETWNARIQAVQDGGMRAVAGSVIERWLTSAYRSSHAEETQAILAMLEGANASGYIANCAAVRDGDVRSILDAIAVPCLVVAGTHDPASTPADGRALAHSIPGAKYVELAAAHLSNVEARDEFNRQVLQFLLN